MGGRPFSGRRENRATSPVKRELCKSVVDSRASDPKLQEFGPRKEISDDLVCDQKKKCKKTPRFLVWGKEGE